MYAFVKHSAPSASIVVGRNATPRASACCLMQAKTAAVDAVFLLVVKAKHTGLYLPDGCRVPTTSVVSPSQLRPSVWSQVRKVLRGFPRPSCCCTTTSEATRLRIGSFDVPGLRTPFPEYQHGRRERFAQRTDSCSRPSSLSRNSTRTCTHMASKASLASSRVLQLVPGRLYCSVFLVGRGPLQCSDPNRETTIAPVRIFRKVYILPERIPTGLLHTKLMMSTYGSIVRHETFKRPYPAELTVLGHDLDDCDDCDECVEAGVVSMKDI
ncbi:hypothetical protein FOZ63_025812 [Perkinsus olseni]|uniref:Uncharacterized protein n=1 Tax=Perkinsus olseni TaxID=32597 RepID=A0A7J6TF69_PEROL|nr:hypothetical protein FOZ63_025812 [Perkinsus olseni]